MTETLISIMCYVSAISLPNRLKDLVLGAERLNIKALLLMQMSYSPGLLPIAPSTIAFRILTILLHWAIL